MNLKVIHVVFVTCAALLAFLFGGWLLAQGGGGATAGGIVAFLAGAGMIAYGFWFWRKIRTPEEERRYRLSRIQKVGAALVAAWIALGDRAANACEVCYGDAGGPMIESARAGVFLLLGLIFLMQACLVVFFLVLRKRARASRREPIPPWWSTIEEPIES